MRGHRTHSDSYIILLCWISAQRVEWTFHNFVPNRRHVSPWTTPAERLEPEFGKIE